MVMCLNQCDYPGENGEPCRCIIDQRRIDAAMKERQKTCLHEQWHEFTHNKICMKCELMVPKEKEHNEIH